MACIFLNLCWLSCWNQTTEKVQPNYLLIKKTSRRCKNLDIKQPQFGLQYKLWVWLASRYVFWCRVNRIVLKWITACEINQGHFFQSFELSSYRVKMSFSDRAWVMGETDLLDRQLEETLGPSWDVLSVAWTSDWADSWKSGKNVCSPCTEPEL